MRGAMLLLLGSASAFCPGGTAALDIEEARMGQSVSPEHSAAQWPLLDHHTIETGRFETGDMCIPLACCCQRCATGCNCACCGSCECPQPPAASPPPPPPPPPPNPPPPPPPPPPPMFTCVVDPPPGTAPCQQSPNGTYPTIAACNATCIPPPPQFFKCVKDAPTPTGFACQPCAATDPNATSLQFCNNTCVAPPPPPPAFKCVVDPPPGTKPCQACDPSDPGAMSLAKCYQTCAPPAIPRPTWPRIPHPHD